MEDYILLKQFNPLLYSQYLIIPLHDFPDHQHILKVQSLIKEAYFVKYRQAQFNNYLQSHNLLKKQKIQLISLIQLLFLSTV
jgi:hypothetical protein